MSSGADGGLPEQPMKCPTCGTFTDKESAVAQFRLQSSVASEAVKKCDELNRRITVLESELAISEKKWTVREAALKAALEMLKQAETVYYVGELIGGSIQLEKMHVADFLLALNRMEDGT